MPPERRRAPLTEGLEGFVPDGAAACLVIEREDVGKLARLARTAAELAVAAGGAAVIVTRRGAAGAALRGARDIGLEPRVVHPRAAEGLSARTPLSLALQGDRASPAFASTAAFVADFVAAQCAPPGGAADPALRGRVASAVSKARERTKVGFDFQALTEQAAVSLAASHPAQAKVKEAIRVLERAEAAAAAYATPVRFASLLEPSPAGRRAGLYIDLSPLSEGAAAQVEALALASLASARPELAVALGGGPVFLVADAPTDLLGRFAADSMASWGAGEAPAVFALYLVEGPREPGAGFPQAAWGEAGLSLPGRHAPLPLARAPESTEPLSAAERRALTPPALRARLFGGIVDEDEEEAEADTSQALLPDPSGSPSARASVEALRAVTGDLGDIARKRTKPGAQAAARKGEYEASDFELK